MWRILCSLSAFCCLSVSSQATSVETSPPDRMVAARPFEAYATPASGNSVRVPLRTDAFDDLKQGASERLLELPLDDGRIVHLELRRFSVTVPDSQFVTRDASGPTRMATPDVVLFRGQISGEPGSHAFMAFSRGGAVNGYLAFENGHRHFVSTGPWPGRSRSAALTGAQMKALGSGAVASVESSGVTISRASADSTWPEDLPVCGVTGAHDLRIESSGIAARGINAGLGPRVIFVAVDTDQEFFQLFNDSAEAQAYIVQVIGAVSDIYIRDFNAKLILTFSRLWPDGGEPFSADSLGSFSGYWDFAEDPTPYHLIHLMSGRRDLPYGGVAFVAGSCSGFAYGIGGFLLGSFPTPVDGPDLGNWDVVVVAHEMGHNMGTFHTHDGYSPPIDTCGSDGIWARSEIMSYCHTTAGGLLNIEMRFSKRIQDVVRQDIEANNCQFFDCNDNGINDALDILESESDDTNSNQIPDECEDCNHNGVLDPTDISGGAPDQNGNGAPDDCEPDCNGNGRPDTYDIDVFGFADMNANRIPDSCEADCDNNEFADFSEIKAASGATDLDRDGVPDSCQDCDGNGASDWIDLLRPENVFVADLGDFIREFHADSGVAVGNQGAGAVRDPHDLTFGPDRMLYVASKGDGRIVRIDPDAGTSETFVPADASGPGVPSALTFGPNGNLFVSSLNFSSVIEYDGTTGAFVRNFVAPGSGGLISPYGLAFGSNGNLFVAGGNRVNEYDGATGAFVQNFVTPGSGGLNDPRGIVFLPDGRLLVVNRANGRILAYDSEGASLGIFNNDGYALTQPWGIAVGPNGNVYAARSSGGVRVIEFDVNAGRYIRSFIRADALLTQPTGIAFRSKSPVDCNANSVLDACDIAAGLEEDTNDNGVPDSCEPACSSVAPVIPDPTGVPMNRYLTFGPAGEMGYPRAIRIRLKDLPPPFEAFEGQYRWVGPPKSLFDSQTSTFAGSKLQCEPFFSDWTVLGHGMLAVYGEAVVPGATYEVQTISLYCGTSNETDYSKSVSVATAAKWGDVVAPFNPPSTATQPDFGDISALVDKFKDVPSAISMARADLNPAVPDQNANFSDISLVVDAFKGVSYPFPGPAPCP